MKKTMIVFNAPKNTGKDAACEHLLKIYPDAEHRAFKEELYELTAMYFELDLEEVISLCTNRDTKEVPNDKFAGMSPRQALIYISEDRIKPFYEKDYFGIALADKCSSNLVFVSDCGFSEEIKAVIDVSDYDVHIVQIYRKGYTFEDDSRNYVSVFGKTHIIHNNGTLEEFFAKVEQTVNNILEKKGN